MLTGREFLKRFHCKLHLAYSFARHKRSVTLSNIMTNQTSPFLNLKKINQFWCLGWKRGGRSPRSNWAPPYPRPLRPPPLPPLDTWPRPRPRPLAWLTQDAPLPPGALGLSAACMGRSTTSKMSATDGSSTKPSISLSWCCRSASLSADVRFCSVCTQRGMGLHVSVHGFTHWCMALHSGTWLYTSVHGLTQWCMTLHNDAWLYTSVHGFTQACMVLHSEALVFHKCAWFYILQCMVYTLTHGFTQVYMVLYMHGLHTDAWFYIREHGFTHWVHCLHTDAWLYTLKCIVYTLTHGFTHCSALFTHWRMVLHKCAWLYTP